jgi:hypothetical protein
VCSTSCCAVLCVRIFQAPGADETLRRDMEPAVPDVAPAERAVGLRDVELRHDARGRHEPTATQQTTPHQRSLGLIPAFSSAAFAAMRRLRSSSLVRSNREKPAATDADRGNDERAIQTGE